MKQINETKQCRKCEVTKPREEFYASKTTKDNLQSYCKSCYSVVNRRANASFSRKCGAALNVSKWKAKNHGVESTLTTEEVRAIFSADHCDYCNKHLEQSEKTLEHVIPYDCGGTNTFGNVTLACRDCNTKKNATPAFEFMLLHGNAEAARRLLYTLAERNGVTDEEYLYTLAKAGIAYRTARLRRIAGVNA